MDLRFASPAARKKFTCATCAEAVKKGRRCEDDGYNNMRRPMSVDQGSLSYNFCPGKATWSPQVAELFEACQLAMDTGIMPKGPNFDDQDEYFAEALPLFINRWRERNYQRVWNDVGEFTNKVLKAVFGDKK